MRDEKLPTSSCLSWSFLTKLQWRFMTSSFGKSRCTKLSESVNRKPCDCCECGAESDENRYALKRHRTAKFPNFVSNWIVSAHAPLSNARSDCWRFYKSWLRSSKLLLRIRRILMFCFCLLEVTLSFHYSGFCTRRKQCWEEHENYFALLKDALNEFKALLYGALTQKPFTEALFCFLLKSFE